MYSGTGFAFFGYTANYYNFGFEPLALGSVRILIGGELHLVMCSAPVLARYIASSKGVNEATISLVDVKAFLAGLSQDEAGKLAAVGLVSVHWKEGSALYVPPCYIAACKNIKVLLRAMLFSTSCKPSHTAMQPRVAKLARDLSNPTNFPLNQPLKQPTNRTRPSNLTHPAPSHSPHPQVPPT